jgi:hypothetical protein
VLEAANPDVEYNFLPSVKRNKDGGYTGKGLCSPQLMADLEAILHKAIKDTAAAMYEGGAGRTPSKDACKYCRMKGSCGVSAE